MPTVPSVGQILAGSSQLNQQSSPTASNTSSQSRRSPPPTSRISPITAKLGNPNGRDRSPQRLNSPPPLVHSQTQPIVTRPIPRIPIPQFLTQYPGNEEKWQMTPELLADIERADQVQGQLLGTSGVAYAGGAASSSHLPARDPAVERVRASDRSSPKDSDGAAKRANKEREIATARDSPKTRERSQTTSSVVPPPLDSLVRTSDRVTDFHGSPPFQTPMASPAERTAAYTQYVPDSYQPSQVASVAVPRKPAPPANSVDVVSSRATPPAASKFHNQSPPLQPANSRPPDRSLPVQEEPEEDVSHPDHKTDFYNSRPPSPSAPESVYAENHSPRYDGRRTQRSGSRTTADEHDDDQTLHDEFDDNHSNKSEDEDDSGFTPRSPSTTLPERPRDSQYSTATTQHVQNNSQYNLGQLDNQKTIRAKHRSGSTDQLGMRGFDTALFENTVQTLRESPSASAMHGQQQGTSSRSAQIQDKVYQTQNPVVPSQEQYEAEARQRTLHQPHVNMSDYSTGSLPAHLSQYSEDMPGFFDDPTSMYLSFMQSPRARPNAPIPPTPQSHTAAPSPSPAISATPSVIDSRQVGSPYPYPFAHIRRTALTAAQNAPSSNYDPNNPAAIREQLALQMQIYAMNNGLGALSDSTFSPSSTPFPGPGYNPWAFMHQAPRNGDSNMSLRSSPSHEPVPMPMPPLRGRGYRKKEPSRVANGVRRRVKPPPRVESTQPRETSPEPSSGSGEETAGEEQFMHAYIPDEGKWTGGRESAVEAESVEEGDWVDEDNDTEDDLLQLEYHPAFITRVDKRKRRWDARWDALVQAFQTLDRETDATMVLLAAPSHSTKLHALTSRSIRRDASMNKSTALRNVRTSFSQLAAHRRASRTSKFSLMERLSSIGSSSSVDSPTGTREEDLRQALSTALASLSTLGSIYEEREARWREEMQRLSEDREHVELLLRQALGPALANGHANGGDHD
ncbi:hypothetical protein K474DRAFT_1664267 [Panus rudis PR-1116 ss-1]|nr:hypothetical protein K474DRAFT_1664267 [Panus rudis PR-1116 ss-1]